MDVAYQSGAPCLRLEYYASVEKSPFAEIYLISDISLVTYNI